MFHVICLYNSSQLSLFWKINTVFESSDLYWWFLPRRVGGDHVFGVLQRVPFILLRALCFSFGQTNLDGHTCFILFGFVFPSLLLYLSLKKASQFKEVSQKKKSSI